jgi:GNAT superfamily N-acetyltransferase
MTEERIRIERIKVGDLENFAKTMLSSLKHYHLVPITLQRAIAHMHNPYAAAEDVGLLVAYYGDECVGYFGIIPIMLKHGDQLSKVYWFSTWLVSPKYRGRSIGSLLMEDALSMDHDYMIVGSGPARKVCRRFGFYELPPLTYYSLDMSGMGRLNPTTWLFRLIRRILSPFKIKIIISNQLTKFVERLLSPIAKLIFYRLGSHHGKDVLTSFSFDKVKEISNHDVDLVEYQPEVSFYRGVEAINWMLKYPWVVQPGKSATEKLGFYFTDVRDVFSNIAIEVYSKDTKEYKGFVIMSYSLIGESAVLKILDVHLLTENDLRSVLPLAIYYGRKFNADKIELPGNVAERMQSRIIRRLLLHEKQRIYQCHPRDDDSPLGQRWREIKLNYSDGDMPFT